MLTNKRNCHFQLGDDDNLTCLNYALLETSKNVMKSIVLQYSVKHGDFNVTTLEDQSRSFS